MPSARPVAEPPVTQVPLVPPPARPRRRTRVLPLAVAAAVGAGAGLTASRLAVNARAYCDAGWEAGGKFELTFEMLFLVPGCAALAVGIAYLMRNRPFSLLVRMLPVVLVLVPVVLGYFAVRGTPAGYHGDSGLCGPDNVPPWWPGWLPS